MTKVELKDYILTKQETEWDFFIMKDLLELNLSDDDFIYALNLLLPTRYTVDTVYNFAKADGIRNFSNIENAYVLAYRENRGWIWIDTTRDRFYLITELILEEAFDGNLYY